jgi:hypothetical protein
VVREVAKLERGSLRPEGLGLSLSEAKALLQELQQAMVTHQIAQCVTQQVPCPECTKRRSRKGEYQIVFRTLFGNEEHCSFSPVAELLRERMAPEFAYLESKFAAKITYGLTAELLAEVLPIGGDINTAGVYRNLHNGLPNGG